MKTLIASTAIAMTLAAPGFAQTQMPLEGGFVGQIGGQAMRATDLIGARLYVSEADVDLTAGLSPDWDDVGEISDIIVGGGGEIDAVLADIGGFLGIGERTVAVDMDALEFVSDGPDATDYFIVLSGNRAGLEEAPAFDDTFERGRTRAMMDPAGGGTGMDTQAGMATTTAGENVVSLDAGTVVDNSQTPATAVVTEGGTTVTTTGEAVDTAAAPVTDAMTDTATATEQAGADAVTAVDSAATDTAAAVGTAATGMAAGGAMMAPPMVERDGYVMVSLDELTTEDVTGAGVYDVNDERVGEIGELVMSDDGRLQDAIIDVGGFLGLGEKPVAVSFESLQILRGEADVRAYVDTTEDALKALPEYQN